MQALQEIKDDGHDIQNLEVPEGWVMRDLGGAEGYRSEDEG